MHWKQLLLALLASLTLWSGLLAPAASAQAPKVGDYFVDDSDLGFKIKMPKDWSFIPPKVGEGNLLGKYNPNNQVPVPTGRETNIYLECWMVKFDRRAKSKKTLEVEVDGETVQEIDISDMFTDGDIAEWIEGNLPGNAWRIVEQDEKKINKVEATEYVFEAASSMDPSAKIKAYVMVYKLHEDCEVAVVFNGPGDDERKWKLKYAKVFEKMAKTLKPIELKELKFNDEIEHADDSPVRAKKRKELKDYVRRTPGWELYETDNYFIISHNNDKPFMKDLMARLEAIREVYMVDYPPEKGRANRPDSPDTGEASADEDGEAGEGGVKLKGFGQSVSAEDPMELARTSVVRVCADQNEYHSYGGPPSSAGYWSSRDQELVIFDTRPRSDTWLVLNHEAFHQFIFYFYGSISPHSWYNEGTGDFYSGYKYKNKKFQIKESEWRKGTASQMIKKEEYVPLKEIVRYTQREYYGNNTYGYGGGLLYAQGWSFVYFLRTGKKKSKDWNDDWDTILDSYLETLASTGDLDKSIDVAFDGVNWDELEAAWKKEMR
ncbi:MAG: hypothetical protein ACI8Q9_000211 [Planctomycetota bacterium]|jgi:hypothetical protein